MLEPEAARDLTAATAAGAGKATIADLPAVSAALAVPRSSTPLECGVETSKDLAAIQATRDSIAPTADRQESKAASDIPSPPVLPT
jgi:hypothetical protein